VRAMFSNEQFPEYDSYFAPIADEVLAFSEHHGLLLDKYYHDLPVWSLCFRHPSGGQAKLDVSTANGQQWSVIGAWWVDNYDLGTRSSRGGQHLDLPSAPARLRAVLESCLASVLAWRPDEWDEVSAGSRAMWHEAWTAEQFDRLQSRWPEPS
jgi:hypothetical protein